MSEVNLIPTGNNCGGFGGDALAAGFGAFVGSWFGNGWGGGGLGGGGLGGRGGAVVGAEIGATAALDSLSNIQNSINGLGLTVVQGQGTSNLTACQGFNGINTTVLTSASQTNNILSQGFAGLNSVINQNGADSRLAIAGLSREMSECCCNIRTAIANEGSATRQLIQQNLITEMQTELCDKKSKIAQLENQIVLNASQQAQNAFLISQLKPATTTA